MPMADQLGGAESQRPFAAFRQLARQAARDAEEHCDLCGEAITPTHRHLLDLASRELQCTCRACALLFDQAAAGGGARKLVPTRILRLPDFALSDAQWESLRIPVNMAFFFTNSQAGRVMALYPGPQGATESLLPLETWEDVVQHNPMVAQIEPDVEALLINRVREARDYLIVPIDECYRLVGLIRLHWRGLTGGREVWQEIDAFFARLRQQAEATGARHA
jgi:hypothetical protein